MKRLSCLIIISLFGISTAMEVSSIKEEQSLIASVGSLQEIIAANLVTLNKELLMENLSMVSEDCKLFLARVYYLQNGYEELASLSSNNRLFVQKNCILQKPSACSHEFNYRPTRHPQNPFLVEDTEDGRATFGFVYKEKYFDGNEDQTREMRRYRNTLSREEGRQYWYHMTHDQFLDYRKKGKVYEFNGLLSPIPRICVGPNNKDFVVMSKNYETFLYYITGSKKRYIVRSSLGHCYGDDPNPVVALALAHDSRRTFLASQSNQLYEVQILSKFRDSDTPENKCIKHEKLSSRLVEMPVPIDSGIIDMHVSYNDEYLWLLTKQGLYTYHIATHEQTLLCELPLIPSDEVIELEDGSLAAKEDISPESVAVFTMSPDEHYVLLGGTEGTVLLVDFSTADCYIIYEIPPEGIMDMWWSTKNEVVILSRSGIAHSFTMAIGYEEKCTFYPPKLPVLPKKEVAFKKIVTNTLRRRFDEDIRWSSHDYLCKGYGLRSIDPLTEESIKATEVSPNEYYVLVHHENGGLLVVDFSTEEWYEVTVLAPEYILDAYWTDDNQLYVRHNQIPWNTNRDIRIYTIDLSRDASEFEGIELPSWDILLPTPNCLKFKKSKRPYLRPLRYRSGDSEDSEGEEFSTLQGNTSDGKVYDSLLGSLFRRLAGWVSKSRNLLKN